MKILYFDCFSGVSGDMIVGAFLDLGLPFDFLQAQLNTLGISDFKVSQGRLEKHKLSAAKFNVEVSEDKAHRHLHHIYDIIDASGLSLRVKEIARDAFRRLAEAEAKIHNSTPEKVHFHEVGAIDAIVDIVSAAIGYDYFNPDRIFVSEIPPGTGAARSAHGIIPIPAPAALEILKGFPLDMTPLKGERVTPTGAAVIASLAARHGGYAPVPAMIPEKVGYGAGDKDFEDRPNCLRLILGQAVIAATMGSDTIEILETNIDDMNPQIFDHLLDRLYSAGAAEVFILPAITKKSRPGFLLTVLCKKELSAPLGDIIFEETTTAGIRYRRQDRWILARDEKAVATPYGKIRVKLLKTKEQTRFQPEYDDCRRAAEEHQVPLQKIMETARRIAEQEEGL